MAGGVPNEQAFVSSGAGPVRRLAASMDARFDMVLGELCAEIGIAG
jgi:hypothetical protein